MAGHAADRVLEHLALHSIRWPRSIGRKRRFGLSNQEVGQCFRDPAALHSGALVLSQANPFWG
jgi:hypothetical protein